MVSHDLRRLRATVEDRAVREELDRIDRRILDLLQANGRMTNADLAEAIHLSPSACLRRVKRLEDAGVIEGYRMIVAQAVIGRSVNVFIEISLQSQSEERMAAFERAIADCEDVMECHLMAGDFDYLVRVAAADTADYEQIRNTLSRLPGVARMRSSLALRTVLMRTAIKMS